MYTGCERSKGSAAIWLYMSVQRVYEHSIPGSLFTPEWCITMRFLPSRTPSVQGAVGLPRMCTQAVGDVRTTPLWSCTGPYSVCKGIPLASERSMPIGHLARGSFRVVHLVNKVPRDFPGCVHNMLVSYQACCHGAVQVRTACERKFC